MGKYSDVLMDHFLAPRNSGHMESPDLLGMVGTPGNGPFMVLYLRIADEMIIDAKFQTYGCGAAIAAGSLLTEMVKYRSIQHCQALTPDELSDALGGVPPDKLHAPAMAIGALRAGLARMTQAIINES